MSGWHQTIIIGNVGGDTTMRYTQGGQAVASFSVAVGEVWYDKTTNEKKEKTTWYKVSCWQKMTETANQYVTKGMSIMITGNVTASGYTNNAGEIAASLELTAREMKFLGGGERRDNQQPNDSGNGDYQGGGNMPDDIPFAACKV